MILSQTVDRALSLLKRMADSPQSLADLAGYLDVHKSTALRLAQSLERAGFARKTGDGHYIPGTQLLRIAAKTLDKFDLRESARQHLSALNKSCGHTIHLASLVDNEVVYIDKYESTASIRMYSQVGKSALLHASGVAKAILAFQNTDSLDRLLAGYAFTKYTPQTLTTREDLERELREIAARGYAFDRGEFEDFISCIAAPVRSADGSISSAVSVSAPRPIASLDELESLLPQLLEATQSISEASGWTHG